MLRFKHHLHSKSNDEGPCFFSNTSHHGTLMISEVYGDDGWNVSEINGQSCTAASERICSHRWSSSDRQGCEHSPVPPHSSESSTVEPCSSTLLATNKHIRSWGVRGLLCRQGRSIGSDLTKIASNIQSDIAWASWPMDRPPGEEGETPPRCTRCHRL